MLKMLSKLVSMKNYFFFHVIVCFKWIIKNNKTDNLVFNPFSIFNLKKTINLILSHKLHRLMAFSYFKGKTYLDFDAVHR